MQIEGEDPRRVRGQPRGKELNREDAKSAKKMQS